MVNSEQRFIQLINAGEAPAYRELFIRFYDTLVYYSAGYVKRPEVAEDIVQEVFIRQWDTRPSFPSENSLKSYLYTAVRNASLDWLKHRRVEEKYLHYALTHPESDDETEYGILREEVYRTLFRTIEQLSPRCREVLRLYLEGKKTEEIADLLRLTPLTVRTHRKNALRTIRERMGNAWLLLFL